MRTDWYRKRSWTPEDQADFYQRLARAREHNRPQYLFIQGYTLLEQDAGYCRAAFHLYDTVIEQYPNSLEVIKALTEKGRWLQRMGQSRPALKCYYCAVERMRVFPNVETWAWLDLVFLVASEEVADQYDAALQLLREFGGQPMIFPHLIFRVNASRALIMAARGDSAAARKAALVALAAADQKKSGLRYHGNMGVVGDRYGQIRERLSEIADPPAPGQQSDKALLTSDQRFFRRKQR